MDLSQLLPFAAPSGGQAPSEQIATQGEDTAGLTQRWRQYLADPASRAALMQFGVSLTQPPSFGDNALSQVGRAVGDAGEAVSRTEESARKQQETESKSQLREAQGTLAEARANTAGARAGTEAARLDLARERLSTTQQLGGLTRRIQATNAYNAYVKDVQSRNMKGQQNATLFGTPFKEEPVLPPQEFYSRHGYGDILSGEGGAAPAPAGTSASAPAAGGPPKNYPDAKQAPDGQWYIQRNGKYFRVD